MKKILLFLTLWLCVFELFSQAAANTWAVKLSDAIMTRWNTTPVSGRVCIDKMTGKGWEYSNSIVLHGMEKVYNKVNTPSYLTYIQTYVDDYVNGSGAFVTATTLNTLDKIHPGIICLFLYEKTGLTRYKTIATILKNVLVGLPAVGTAGAYHRTVNGIFWHKDNASTYDNVVMLDGMYMAYPFLAKYGSLFGDNAAIDTAVNQTLFTYNQLYDVSTHLIKHAWTSTPASYTWDGPGGNSNAVWSRAMGWYMMALVDILKYIPASHPKRAQLLTAFGNLAFGIKNYQDATSGLWYQVVDETTGSLAGNYLETSGSAMFVYALKTACDNSWINSATYLPVAQNGWTGLKNNSIDLYTSGDNLARVKRFAPAMSVLATKALYASTANVDCPATTHPHGYAAMLMAASVMEFPPGSLPVHFTSFTATLHNGTNVSLSWQNTDDNEADYYEVQRSGDGNHYSAIGKIIANGSGSYKWTGNNVAGNVVYYRIKAFSKTSEVIYSAILFIKLKQGITAGINVSPNPVKGGSVNVSMNNIKAGKYTLRIMNNIGKVIESKSIRIMEDGLVQIISIPVNAYKGLYYIQLDGGGILIDKPIIVE